MTLWLTHIFWKICPPSLAQKYDFLFETVVSFGKNVAQGASPKYCQDVDSPCLKVIYNYFLINVLTCLPLLEEGTTPIAKVQALSSGHNSPALLTDPWFSLV